MYSFLPNLSFWTANATKTKFSLIIKFATVEKRSHVSHFSVLHGNLSGMHVQMISNHGTNRFRHCAVNGRSQLD